ncbi:DUF3048 domain-containing protein [Propioniciclava soli]|uniref:DUF3048 domain-containing protein n=1 Tax=Propioniciclava soli TaxID=2775081 RepID=A0ABZ3C734_9ACTN
MTPLSRRAILAAFVGTAAVGCSAPAAAPSPTPTATPTAPAPSVTPTPEPDARPRWPLTGQLVDDPALVQHAAVAVKVPDTRVEHPQLGLNDADLVFVQLDGYPDAHGESATRLVPVFHSRFPDAAGPVRSLRPSDLALLGPLRAVVGSTGAAGWVASYLAQRSDILDTGHTYLATRGTGAYSIDPSRIRTLSGKKYYDRAVRCHPALLAEVTGRFADGPPAPYLPYATGEQTPSTEAGFPATTVIVPWKSGSDYAMGYVFDAASGRYERSMPWGPHVLADGSRVTTDNVLVILAGQGSAKLAEGEGGPEPIHEVTDASGRFHYAHGGRAVSGQWSKAGVDAPFQFTLDSGEPLRVAPGRTFVELPRADAAVQIS